MSAELSVTDAVLFRDAAPAVDATVETAPPPAVHLSATRRLPLPRTGESLASRLGWMAVALGVTLLYFYALMSYWAPAHPGVDQNGYFAGGRQFATTLSSGLKPESDFGFIGRMWVREPETGINYPKYPLGLPILYAACLKWFGEARGVEAAHLISPICAALGVLGVFAITRRLAGGFIGIMAMLLFACGQVMVTLAVNPNSHASCTCAVVWGMFFLLRWLESGTLWRGMLAAFLFGVAYTIRYTEGLLLLPLGVAMLYATRWRRPTRDGVLATLLGPMLLGVAWMFLIVGIELHSRMALASGGWRVFAWPSGWGLALTNALHDLPTRWPALEPLAENNWRVLTAMLCAGIFALGVSLYVQGRSLWRLLLVGVAWLLPVTYLTVFNMLKMRAFTSYAGTNESTGFAWSYFLANWEKMVRVMNDQGLFFIAPLGLLGLVCMFRRLPIVATILTLWYLPSVLLYTAYYWAPDNMGVSYSRFILTQLPALVVAAAWLLGEVGRRLAGPTAGVGRRLARLGTDDDNGSLLTTLAFAVLAAVGLGAIVFGAIKFDPAYDSFWWAIVGPGGIAAIVGLCALPSVVSPRWADAFDRHFARSTTRLAVGCVVFVSCSLGLYRTVQGAEWGQRLNVRANIEIQSRQNNNLWGLGTEVRRAVGQPGSDADVLLFADGERLHHLQWLGGWQLFDVNAFNADRAQRGLSRQTPDENDPDPIDPSRVKFLRDLYRGKDQRALQKAQDDLIADALVDGKRVLFALNSNGANGLARQIDRRRFDVKWVGTYNDVPAPRTPVDFLAPGERPKEPVNRFGRGNALNNPNAFAGPRESMKIGEVVLKPPTTQKAG